MSIPDYVIKYFEQQQREQQSHVTTALVTKNLRETTITMQSVMEKIGQRGTQVSGAEEDVNELLASSEEFLDQTKQSWWKWLCSCIPEWWCSRRREKKRG